MIARGDIVRVTTPLRERARLLIKDALRDPIAKAHLLHEAADLVETASTLEAHTDDLEPAA